MCTWLCVVSPLCAAVHGTASDSMCVCACGRVSLLFLLRAVRNPAGGYRAAQFYVHELVRTTLRAAITGRAMKPTPAAISRLALHLLAVGVGGVPRVPVPPHITAAHGTNTSLRALGMHGAPGCGTHDVVSSCAARPVSGHGSCEKRLLRGGARAGVCTRRRHGRASCSVWC